VPVRRAIVIGTTAAAIVAVVIVTTTSAGSSKKGASNVTLTLYSGQHPETVAALASAFTKLTGINISVRSADEGVLAAQIIQEGSRSPADIFMTENSPPLEALQQHGLLTRVDSSTLGLTPAAYSSPQRDWEGVSARVSTMVYNTNDLKPSQLPRSVLELANPEWNGKLALAPGETDFQPIVTAVADRYGQARAVAWLKGIRANASSHIYPDNEALVAQINSGQAALGVINHYYWFRLRDEIGVSNLHSAEKLFSARDPGYVIDVAGAGLLASSTHKPEAQRFLAFLVSRAAQEIIAHDQSYEYPLGSGVVSAKPLVRFASLKPDPITVAELGDGTLAINLLREASLL
jgi:iron(III) transport system substrate-binding protein